MPDAPKNVSGRLKMLVDRLYRMRYGALAIVLLLGIGGGAIGAFFIWKSYQRFENVSQAVVKLAAGMGVFVFALSVAMGLLHIILRHRVSHEVYQIEFLARRLIKGETGRQIEIRELKLLSSTAELLNMISFAAAVQKERLMEARDRLLTIRKSMLDRGPLTEEDARMFGTLEECLTELLEVKPSTKVAIMTLQEKLKQGEKVSVP